MGERLRLFTAIRPPATIRDCLSDTMGGIQGARWQDDDQLHLTLTFLGDVGPHATEDLLPALEAVRVAPFELAIRGVGHFERKGAPSALWAGLAPNEPLVTLQKRVVAACRRAGCPPDGKTFRPHITLARLSRGAGPIGGWLAQHALLSSDPWTVESFALYQSHLRPEGSQYEPVAVFRLMP